MQDRDPGVRVAVGVSGAGKTHGVKAQVFRAARHIPVIVIDRMHEWNGIPAELAELSIVVRSAASAKEMIARGARLAIVRCSDAASEAEIACAWARDYDGVAGVAIPEAHRVAPQGKLPRAIEDAACTWRHHRVAVWLDTQRFALLNRTLIEQAGEIRVYACGPRDVDAVVTDLGGRELGDSIREVGKRLAAGKPGWYVKLLQTSIEPPYKLERES